MGNLPEEFEFIRVTANHEDKIFQFLLDNFYPDEPLNNSLGRKPENKDACPALKYISDNLSLAVVRRTDKSEICGVVINMMLRKDDSNWEELSERHKNTPYESIVNFFQLTNGKLRKAMTSYTDIENEKTLYTAVVSVSESMRRQGIGLRLLEKTLDLAKELQLKYYVIECTSAHSAKLAEKIGCHVLYLVPYEDYKDEKGIPYFKTKDCHRNFTSYIKTLS